VIALFVLLLIVFFAAFFGFDKLIPVVGVVSENHVQIATIQDFQISLNLPALRAFLGGGIVFFEFIIIVFSVFDRVLDTIRALIRPLAVLVPLGAFLVSAYKTFEPIIRILLPAPLGTGSPNEIEAAVSGETFNANVLLTFGFMVVYLITTFFLKEESKEVKALRAEIAKLRRQRG
jgi:hypothetical protein